MVRHKLVKFRESMRWSWKLRLLHQPWKTEKVTYVGGIIPSGVDRSWASVNSSYLIKTMQLFLGKTFIEPC